MVAFRLICLGVETSLHLRSFVLTGGAGSGILFSSSLTEGHEKMSAIATRFSNATTKFQVGVATCAVAAAATLTPAIAAQADIATPAPLAPVTQVIDNIAQDNWLQNQLWWIGTANPNPPAQTTVLVFTPLSLIRASSSRSTNRSRAD